MYWGQDINCAHEGYRTFDIIRDNLETALKASGMKCRLWTVLDDGFECSCKKDEGFDVDCASCYGTGLVIGYKQYQYDYFVFDPFRAMLIDQTHSETGVGPNFNPAEIEIVQKWKPYMLGLKAGVLTAQITWQIPVYENIFDISYDRKDYIRDMDAGASSITIEISLDNGTTWSDISAVTGIDLQVPVIDPIIRVTLTRSSTTVRTPLFQILRIKGRAVDPGYILMSRTRNPADLNFEKKGVVDREGPVGLWTIQDFIIKPVTAERQRGSMIEMLDSPFATLRYELFNPVQSFWKDHTFRQVFEARVISRDREIFWKIF